jgi:hypothetical protein
MKNQENINDTKPVLTNSFFRPTSMGELLEALKKGIKCEVANNGVEAVNIKLNGWLKFEGKYRTLYSPNKGWIIYEAV